MSNFSLTEKQKEKLSEWIRLLPDKIEGAIGGRYTFLFTPTSIGIAVSVRDNITQLEIDLTEYEDW